MNAQPGDDLRETLQLLEKVLALETRKEFGDKAVTGGLSRFVNKLAGRASQSWPGSQESGLRLARLFSGYADLSPEERAVRVHQALELVRSLDSGRDRESKAPASRVAETIRPRRPVRDQPRPANRPTIALDTLDTPVGVLPGVGPQRARQLAAIGVATVGDLVYLIPRAHKDYTQVQLIASILFHRECTIRGRVTNIQADRTQSGKTLVTAEIDDGTGRVRALWFNPYIARQVKAGDEIAISGRVEQQRGMLCFRNPEWERLDAEMLHTGRLVPVYPLTRGLYQKQVRGLTRMALDAGLPLIREPLTPPILERNNLIPLPSALEWIHYPESAETLHAARARLAFDEFLALQIGLVQRKVEWQSATGHSFASRSDVLERFLGSLPFELTAAQRRSLKEILTDMASPKPMSRLLQGDVGSGKTVVAASAALIAVADGFQVAILAPTEILAEQHFRSFSSLFEQLAENQRPTVALLTGSSTAVARQAIDERLRTGELNILVGTHALLEQRVSFQRLGLAVIDEQHRFGVAQRARLRDKGQNPDVLVMTATPIPRSLALVMHGDLDVSVIDELPPGRQPIETYRVSGNERRRIYRFIRKQVDDGYQAFIIYPLVEESEAVDARAATAEFERLTSQVFSDLRLGLLHGRLRPSEKDAVMTAFRDGEIDVLVSTSVVEVGIDVPNATTMVIEGANRFGLAQLHQFRGRVGRGSARSYCILVADEAGEDGRRRLDALVETQDGFRLAEIDLEMRGPGEFFGTRQSGVPELKFASLGDLATLQRARAEAHRILEWDRLLERPEHRALREHVDRFWTRGAGDLS